jgi:hypothetical protein
MELVPSLVLTCTLLIVYVGKEEEGSDPELPDLAPPAGGGACRRQNLPQFCHQCVE